MNKLGPYKILRTIAMGGMGEVYLAALERAGGFEKQVALKCILPSLMREDRFVELFEREARLAAVLSHRNIVQVFDFGREADRAWLAMEFVDGVDLKQVFDRVDQIPLNIVLDIGIQCARALHYAHRATDGRGRALHIIHRDVSPQNILLSYEGDVKLADFGLAHAAARGADDDGALKGKFAYMSPEQALTDPLDERTDQFSLGIVLLELLTGQRAFHHNDGTAAILQRVARVQTRVSLHDDEYDVPMAVKTCITRALALDRRDRFADSGQFAQALESAAFAAGINLGSSNIGQWLRVVFPDRTHRIHAGDTTLLEGTAVASDPIATKGIVDAVEVTAFADTPVSPLEGTVDAAEGVSRPQRADDALTPRQFVVEQPSNKADSSATASMVMPEKSLQPTESGSPIRLYLAALAILLAFVLALVWSPTSHTDSTARDTAVSRAAQSVTVTTPMNTANGSRAASQSATEPDAGRSAPVDAAPTQLPPDAGQGQPATPNPTMNADGMTKNQEHSGPSQPEVSAKRPSKTSIRRRRTKRLPKRLETEKSRTAPKWRRSTSKRSPSMPKRDRGLANARRPASVNARLMAGQVLPKKMSPPVEKMPSEVVRSDSPIMVKPQLVGPRVRLVTRRSGIRVTGAKPVSSWYPIKGKGILLRTKPKIEPRVTMRISSNGGRFHAAIHASPHGSLFVNQRPFGSTPIAAAPLAPGRQVIGIRTSDGKETRLTLELAQ